MPTTNRNWRCMRRPGLLFEILIPVWLSEQRLCGTIEAQLASAQSEIEAEKVAWESSKKKLDQVET